MTTFEILICAAVIANGVLIALAIDWAERKIDRARYTLARQARTTEQDAIDWRDVVQRLVREDGQHV